MTLESEGVTRQWDYIVVGAGSSGSVVANKLSGPGGGSVLLLEAGRAATDIRHRIPAAARQLWYNPSCTWMFSTVGEPGLQGRRVPVARGKVLGGSSAINGGVYNRGSRFDYESWAERGLPLWTYGAVVPYFKRIERHWSGLPQYGTDGPVPVTQLQVKSPLTSRTLNAAQEMGFPLAEHAAGAEPEGWGLPTMNVDERGRRVTSADAFLSPIRHRPTLRIETRARVLRILIEKGRAIGVEYLHGSERRVAYAAREVVLSGGAVSSPAILLLSGIGPADELRAVGVETRLDLPGVGRDFNDQPAGFLQFKSKLPLTFERNLRLDRLALAVLRWSLGLSSPLSGPPVIASANLRTARAGKAPDLRMMLTAATSNSRPWFPGIAKGAGHLVAGMFALGHPKSRGSITLASSDPLAQPNILYNILTHADDIADIRHAYYLMRELISQPSLADVVGEFVMPASTPTTDDEVDSYIRRVVRTTAHPLGSCQMGVGRDAVVDEQCRVRGIDALRVIDLAVFPVQISGNPHGPAMMLADRVTDMMLGKPPLPADLATVEH
jgi:choline dehydrogenase